MKKALPVLALALLLLLLPSRAWAAEDWQNKPIPLDVESGVICVLDGCNMVLSSCDDAAAQKMRGIIREKMYKDGMNKQQVYAYLSSVYGESVLAAPPKKGFDWVAWITPFVAAVGGAVLVYLGLEKWVIPGRAKEGEENGPAPIDSVYAEKLDEELKRYL